MLYGRARTLFRQLHLYAGLFFGSLFMLSGLSGSSIVWLPELDSMLNPDLFQAVPASGASVEGAASITANTVQEVIEALTADPAYGRPLQITLPEYANEALIAWYRVKPSGNASLLALRTDRQVMVNPYTLQVNGERNWGEIGVSRRVLMPTLFHFHRYLIAGELGKILVGISGLVLFVTSVIGLVLWWPKPNRSALRRAFTISHAGSWRRFNYSFHKVAGFFAAPILIVIGFSGWYLNLPKWVTPIVSSIATVSAPGKQNNQTPIHGTQIPPEQALTIAQGLYSNARISRISLPSTASTPYRITLRQPDEVRQDDGATRVTIDAYSGKVLRLQDPMNAPGGDTFLNWLYPLHSRAVFGNAGRWFLTFFGVVPLLFLISGWGIWLRRRKIHRP
ncbi:PepSY-associated TM helix domain-containing protein [Pusillimonas sp.]|uniref:PepSY-associated TM helix domain-containing protein n=1 Tax=Pusillimonas sp. TaxID=3040095 RepID=UPI0037CBBCBF